MKRVLVACLTIVLICLVVVSSKAVRANSASLQLTIEDLQCTLDTTYSQNQPSLSLQPADCSQDTIVENLQAQDISLPPEALDTVAPIDVTPGDQKIFENTPLESFAAWSGVGNSTVSAMRPVLATGFLAATTFAIIDMVFLELRATQAALGFTRLGMSWIARVVTRGF